MKPVDLGGPSFADVASTETIHYRPYVILFALQEVSIGSIDNLNLFVIKLKIDNAQFIVRMYTAYTVKRGR